MWRKVRVAFLLLILGAAAWSNWYDRLSTTDWDETLYVGVRTVRSHVASILAKLGVPTRTAATAHAIHFGLVDSAHKQTADSHFR